MIRESLTLSGSCHQVVIDTVNILAWPVSPVEKLPSVRFESIQRGPVVCDTKRIEQFPCGAGKFLFRRDPQAVGKSIILAEVGDDNRRRRYCCRAQAPFQRAAGLIQQGHIGTNDGIGKGQQPGAPIDTAVQFRIDYRFKVVIPLQFAATLTEGQDMRGSSVKALVESGDPASQQLDLRP